MQLSSEFDKEILNLKFENKYSVYDKYLSDINTNAIYNIELPTGVKQAATITNGLYKTVTSSNYNTYTFTDIGGYLNKYITFSATGQNYISYPYTFFAFDATDKLVYALEFVNEGAAVRKSHIYTVFIENNWSKFIILSHSTEVPFGYISEINPISTILSKNSNDIDILYKSFVNNNINPNNIIFLDILNIGNYNTASGAAANQNNNLYLRCERFYMDKKDIIIINNINLSFEILYYSDTSLPATNYYSNKYIPITSDNYIYIKYDEENPVIGINIYKYSNNSLTALTEDEKAYFLTKNDNIKIYYISNQNYNELYNELSRKVLINNNNILDTFTFIYTVNFGSNGGERSDEPTAYIRSQNNANGVRLISKNSILWLDDAIPDDIVVKYNFYTTSNFVPYSYNKLKNIELGEIVYIPAGTYIAFFIHSTTDGFTFETTDSANQYIHLTNLEFDIKELVSNSLNEILVGDITIKNNLLEYGKEKLLTLNKENSLFNFTLITDTHLKSETSNFKCNNTVDLFVMAAKYGKFAINCGDITQSTNINRIGTIKNIELWTDKIKEIKCPVYSVRGNHDTNSRYPSESTYDYTTNYIDSHITTTEFDVLTQSFRQNVIYNKNDPNGCYYYKDFEEYNIRIIVLNCYRETKYDIDIAHGNEQIRWLAEEALNFTDKSNINDWAVMIFQHRREFAQSLKEGTIGYNPITILESFREGIDCSSSYTNIDCSHFVTQGKMNIIAICAGTNHDDKYYRNIFGGNSNININVIQFDNAFTQPTDYIVDEIGTEYEYCVSYLSVDVKNKKLYEIRMGRNSYAVGGYASSESRFGYRMQKTDPNTGERKEDRSWSYGINNADNKILSGIDDANTN